MCTHAHLQKQAFSKEKSLLVFSHWYHSNMNDQCLDNPTKGLCFYRKLVLKVSVHTHPLGKSSYWIQFSKKKKLILKLYFILKDVQWELFSRKYLKEFNRRKKLY